MTGWQCGWHCPLSLEITDGGAEGTPSHRPSPSCTWSLVEAHAGSAASHPLQGPCGGPSGVMYVAREIFGDVGNGCDYDGHDRKAVSIAHRWAPPPRPGALAFSRVTSPVAGSSAGRGLGCLQPSQHRVPWSETLASVGLEPALVGLEPVTVCLPVAHSTVTCFARKGRQLGSDGRGS